MHRFAHFKNRTHTELQREQNNSFYLSCPHTVHTCLLYIYIFVQIRINSMSAVAAKLVFREDHLVCTLQLVILLSFRSYSYMMILSTSFHRTPSSSILFAICIYCFCLLWIPSFVSLFLSLSTHQSFNPSLLFSFPESCHFLSVPSPLPLFPSSPTHLPTPPSIHLSSGRVVQVISMQFT